MQPYVNKKHEENKRHNMIERYCSTRNQTVYLSKPLSEADMTIQAADFASPGKWHLAHTTWFFEEFFLRALISQTARRSYVPIIVMRFLNIVCAVGYVQGILR